MLCGAASPLTAFVGITKAGSTEFARSWKNERYSKAIRHLYQIVRHFLHIQYHLKPSLFSSVPFASLAYGYVLWVRQIPKSAGSSLWNHTLPERGARNVWHIYWTVYCWDKIFCKFLWPIDKAYIPRPSACVDVMKWARYVFVSFLHFANIVLSGSCVFVFFLVSFLFLRLALCFINCLV